MDWNNKKLVLKKINQDAASLKYASEELRGDREVVMAAISKVGLLLNSASKELRNDKELVLVAVKKDGMALYSASEFLQSDKDLLLELEKFGENARRFFPKWYWERMEVLKVYKEQELLEHSMSKHQVAKSNQHKF
jgi:hypothetical protein